MSWELWVKDENNATDKNEKNALNKNQVTYTSLVQIKAIPKII